MHFNKYSSLSVSTNIGSDLTFC